MRIPGILSKALKIREIIFFFGVMVCAISSVYGAAFPGLDQRPAVMSSKATESLLTDIERVGDKLITVGERGHILVSTDGGVAWSQSEVPVQLLLTAVSFPNEMNGWAVGHEGVILNSQDGGASWQVQFAKPYQHLSEEQLSELTDTEFAKLPQAGSPLLDVWFKDANVGFAVGAYGMFFCTVNAGVSWQDCSHKIDNPDGWHLNGFIANSEGTYYIAGERGTLFRSQNEGETWQTLASPYSGSFFGGLVGRKASEVYFFGLQGNIYYSANQGDTFEKVLIDSSDSIMSGLLTQEGLIFVGNSGLLIVGDANQQQYNVHTMDDRKAILALAKGENGALVLVGQGGVRLYK